MNKMPDKTVKIKIDVKLNTDELERLKKGHNPTGMSDHWGMFYENNKCYIYRSWTHNCIYIVDIPEDGFIIDVIVNNDESQHEFNEMADKYQVEHLIYCYADRFDEAMEALDKSMEYFKEVLINRKKKEINI